jgi:hypothetical protein
MSGDSLPERFVILAAPRSGSNLLCTLLNSHPDIVCHHEVFNPQGIFYALEYRDAPPDLGTREDRDREPLEFLAHLWREDWGVPHVGFKMTRGQDERILTAVLEDRDIRKIVLRRANPLRTYVSELISRETGKWEAYRPTELPVNRPRVRVNLEEFRSHVDANNAFYRRLEDVLERSGQVWHAASYECLFSRREHQRQLVFLGVNRSLLPLAPRSIRQNPESLRDLVSNYRELESALDGTDPASLLNAEETFVYDEIPSNA